MVDHDIVKPYINIPIPGPFILLDSLPLILLYLAVVYYDYYLYCQTSIPYQKYKNWHRLFHLCIPFIIAPRFHASATSFISYPWFVASVGAYAAELYKKLGSKQPQSFKAWIKSVGIEAFAQSPDQQVNGISITLKQVRMEGIKRALIGTAVMISANVWLTPLLLDDPKTLWTFHWYSPKCTYYGLLMGLKGYALFKSNDIILAIVQIITGVKIIHVFDSPFAATTLKDFWGRRWNRVVSTLFRKQVLLPDKTASKAKSIVALKRLRAFCISALMHEVIMTIINRQITLEQTAFFMISGVVIYIQDVFPLSIKMPKIMSIVLTMLFLGCTSKLFFAPFLRYDEQCVMFSKHAFV